MTVEILKSTNKLLQDTLFLTPLISLDIFSCILNTALLPFTPPQNMIPYFNKNKQKKNRLRGFSLKANYTDHTLI
jgi:hypothetical protein